ncbi:MAG: serine hydrolase domain-containing protein [Chloroflexota bacterium]
MKKFILLLLLSTILFTTTAVSAQTPSLSDPAELATFLDPRIQEAMDEASIPGAIVVIVKDGQILFNEGYGVANLKTGQPIDPDTTGFRVASLTKLLTATAVLQLADQGLVDLHADVDQYLPFTLPNTYPEPITLYHLLTHSSGLDDSQTGDAAHTPTDIVPLADYLAKNLPDRIHPPGQLIDYSNHGYALAGYIVEVVSKRPFANYVNEEILQPLNMTYSTLHQPPPSHITPATGYSSVASEPLRPEPLDFSNVAPADALIASGTDMAQFMLAHLQTDNSPLLSANSLTQMRQTQFSHHPQLRGRTYGFLEWKMNGHRLLTHTGGQLGFVSLMTLYPEENLGIFIAQNGRFGNLRFRLFEQFMNRYYPKPLTITPINSINLDDLSPYMGHYRSVENYFPTTYEKVATVFGAVDEVEILDNGDGRLTIWDNSKLIPLDEPHLFQLNGRSTRAFFQADENNRVTHLFLDDTAYERISWWETAVFHRNLMRWTILVLGTAVVLLPLAALLRRWQARRTQQSFRANWAHQLAFFISLLAITFFAALDFSADTLADQIDYGVPTFFIIILTLPIISTLLTLPLSWLTLQSWRQRNNTLLGRTYLTLLTLATILYALILNYWNLLGYKF